MFGTLRPTTRKSSHLGTQAALWVLLQYLGFIVAAPLLHWHEEGHNGRASDQPAVVAAARLPAGASCPICHWKHTGADALVKAGDLFVGRTVSPAATLRIVFHLRPSAFGLPVPRAPPLGTV